MMLIIVYRDRLYDKSTNCLKNIYEQNCQIIYKKMHQTNIARWLVSLDISGYLHIL